MEDKHRIRIKISLEEDGLYKQELSETNYDVALDCEDFMDFIYRAACFMFPEGQVDKWIDDNADISKYL